MKFVVSRTSLVAPIEIKNFTDVKELITFMNEVNNPLIIHENFWYKETNIEYIESSFPNINTKELITTPYEIEIYDDYRE